jgi:AcrR family transcriptional regulator
MMNMVAKQQNRQRVINLLSLNLLEKGLSKTSLRQLADAAGVSDRMLLYYFADKTDILSSVISQIASDMSDLLASAIPISPKLNSNDFIARALRVTQGAGMKPYMQLWVEIVASAARGQQPYATLAKHISLGFVEWIESRLESEAGINKHAISAMIFAIIDGVALLDICAGETQAKRAAKAIGQMTFTNKATA